MPEPTVWYEISGHWSPRITKRLVSTETAAYVFHPNGRKSLKGRNWYKTFEEARVELVSRATAEIASAEESVANARNRLLQVQNITEESTS